MDSIVFAFFVFCVPTRRSAQSKQHGHDAPKKEALHTQKRSHAGKQSKRKKGPRPASSNDGALCLWFYVGKYNYSGYIALFLQCISIKAISIPLILQWIALFLQWISMHAIHMSLILQWIALFLLWISIQAIQISLILRWIALFYNELASRQYIYHWFYDE